MLGCSGRPASLSLHIETKGSEKTMTFLLHKLHFAFKIASLCRAFNLLRCIFIINKSYLNTRILFNSFTYVSVCVCFLSFASTLPHNSRESVVRAFGLDFLVQLRERLGSKPKIFSWVICELFSRRVERVCVEILSFFEIVLIKFDVLDNRWIDTFENVIFVI